MEKSELKIQRDTYRKAYNILMEYWDSFNDEQQQEINNQLNNLGL
jgi:hypothetical protein